MTDNAKKVPIHLQSSQNRLLIKNGRIVNDDSVYDADIFIENGIIAQIGHNLTVPGGVRVIDARSSSQGDVNYIIPGGIDSHTHLQSEFMGAKTADDYYSGSRAALAGGTTTFVNFAMTSPREPSLINAFERERRLADEVVCCDYTLHVVISKWIEGETEKEIAALVILQGVTSFKVFLCYDMQLSDKELISIFRTCSKYGAIVMAHCENGDIIEFNAKKLIENGVTGPEGHLYSRPECIEAEATKRASVLADQVGCPLLVAHVMSKSASDVIVQERSRGAVLFGETLGSALATDGTHYFNKCWRHAAAHVMSPPLRPDPTTGDHLMGMLAAGSLQIVGSDHCVFNAQQKALGENDFRKIPNGINGIEERMMIVWDKGVRTGKIDVCKFVALTSTNAAKMFNMYPKKGRIQVGSDADLVIWGKAPRIIRAENHQSKCDYNIFEGLKVESAPLVVVCAGRVVLDQTGLHVRQGCGRYVSKTPFAPLAFGALKVRNQLIPAKVDRSGALNDALASDLNDKLHIQVAAAGVDTRYAHNVSPRPGSSDSGDHGNDGYHSRSTKSGVRNMQDSTFKLSGEQIDDKNQRSNIRVSGQPPGGRSSGLW
ncbi:Dihydropyrimidinase-related protein 3, partial [Fragariocoptes setiger]